MHVQWLTAAGQALLTPARTVMESLRRAEASVRVDLRAAWRTDDEGPAIRAVLDSCSRSARQPDERAGE